VSKGVDQKERSAPRNRRARAGEVGQQHNQDRSRARRRYHAEEQPQNECAEETTSLGLQLAAQRRDGDRQHAHQVKSHRHAHRCDDPVPHARHVPVHSAGKCGDHAKHGEGHGQTEDEYQGEQESP